MEKSGDFMVHDVTPSAPPTYSEAIRENYAGASSGLHPAIPIQPSQGLYPAIPTQPSQAYSYPSPAVQQPTGNSQFVPTPYPPQEGAPIQAPRTVGMLPVGPKPLKTVCPSCQKYVATRTNTKNVFFKYFCCLLLFATGICIPCSCIPFCVLPHKVEHFCPSCNAYLGMYVK